MPVILSQLARYIRMIRIGVSCKFQRIITAQKSVDKLIQFVLKGMTSYQVPREVRLIIASFLYFSPYRLYPIYQLSHGFVSDNQNCIEITNSSSYMITSQSSFIEIKINKILLPNFQFESNQQLYLFLTGYPFGFRVSNKERIIIGSQKVQQLMKGIYSIIRDRQLLIFEELRFHNFIQISFKKNRYLIVDEINNFMGSGINIFYSNKVHRFVISGYLTIWKLQDKINRQKHTVRMNRFSVLQIQGPFAKEIKGDSSSSILYTIQ